MISKEKIVYAIKNKEGKYATYGRSEFKEGLRFARLYKSKETALRYYFSNCGQYEDLSLVKIKIKVLSEEELFTYQFTENRRYEMLSKKEIALELTKIINENMNEYSEKHLSCDGVINTYKKVLKEIKNVK